VGIRKATPLMNTLAHSVAASAITSIDQRLRLLIDETDTPTSSHIHLMMLNVILIY